MATKKRSARAASKPAPAPTKYLMVTFGKSQEAVSAAFEERARQLGWSRSALAREIIRLYFGFSSHLKK